MEFCHGTSHLPSPALEQLGQFVLEWGERRGNGTPDFERFEHELHERIQSVERDLLREELEKYDVKAEQIEVAGIRYRQVLISTETYLSAGGPLQIQRHLYRPPGRGSKCICPLVSLRQEI